MRDGGPAFPSPHTVVEESIGFPETRREYQKWSNGMTLRQWYAGLAMQALIASWSKIGNGWIPEREMAEIAKESHQLSDAMIAEGEK